MTQDRPKLVVVEGHMGQVGKRDVAIVSKWQEGGRGSKGVSGQKGYSICDGVSRERKEYRGNS